MCHRLANLTGDMHLLDDARHFGLRKIRWTRVAMGWDGMVSRSLDLRHLHGRCCGADSLAAVIMVDPAFSNTCGPPPEVPSKLPPKPEKITTTDRTPDGIILDEVTKLGLEESLILQDPTTYDTRAHLWKAQEYGNPQPVKLHRTLHKSWPYHHGCSTLAPLMFSQVGIGSQESNISIFKSKRNLTSALDEMVFYWTRLATPQLISHTNAYSSNASYYLLKHIAQHWINHLELMNTTIAKAEWFSDDYAARIDDNLSRATWKSDLMHITEISQDINYMRRHLNHFWRAMVLNLERLGVQLGSESVDGGASLAIRDAQRDFLTIHTRMQPMRDRAEALNSVSNDLANLRAAFRGVHDGEFGLRLSLFASIVFPLTLVASIFSMGDDYLPGGGAFWKLWAIGPPFCVSVALALVYGKRPWRLFIDIWEFVVLWRQMREKRKMNQDRPREIQSSSGTAQLKRADREGVAKRVALKTKDEEQGFVR
jgi:Mg2+ and Co2+ transporter CorA